jgi:anti-anti-sigma regulatory factor
MFPTSNQASGLRISLFEASGAFTYERCERLADTIEHLALSGWRSWVLDFSAAEHVNYRGLERLLGAANALEARGGCVRWCGMSAYLRDLARLAGAHDRPLYRNRIEAAADLKGVFDGA